MTDPGIISIILILVNVAVSYRGLSHEAFQDHYKFEVDPILIRKDYKRLITSGFLHVSWVHLIFNMLSLYAFSASVEELLGGVRFLVVYFSALVGGNLLALFIHRHHGYYSSVGASGAISGVIFASIALFPGIGIGFFGLPVHIPGWLYGVLYLAFSIYGIRAGREQTGHEAHLGGALVGVFAVVMMVPSAIVENYLTIALIMLPGLLFIYAIVSRPHLLLLGNRQPDSTKHYSVDHRYNEQRNNRQQEIDKLLDKISKKEINSLSKKEKALLEEHARSSRQR